MSAADHKETARRFIAALASDGNLDVLNDICAPAVAQQWRAIMEDFSFSERTFTVNDIVAEGPKVAMLWSIAGRHTSEYAGIPPTGRRTSNTGSAFFTFDDGKITELVTHFDADDLYRQLGATITPSP
jgi:steroid delta-isomerase-like uncharacterized protein